jgi:hypothetical protein
MTRAALRLLVGAALIAGLASAASAQQPVPATKVSDLSVRLTVPKRAYFQGEEVLGRVSFANTRVTREAGPPVLVPPVVRPLGLELVDMLRGPVPAAVVSRSALSGLRLRFGRQEAQGLFQHLPGTPLPGPITSIRTAPFNGELYPGQSAEADFSLLAEDAALPAAGYKVRLSFAVGGVIHLTEWTGFTVFAAPAQEAAPRTAYIRLLAQTSPEGTLAAAREFLSAFPRSLYAGRVRRRGALAAHALGEWRLALELGERLLSPRLEPMGQLERDQVTLALAEALWHTGQRAAAERLLFSTAAWDAPAQLDRLPRMQR